MQTIDIRNNNLIPDEYMLLTKAGKRWRPNWSKMVADKINIIAHSNTYTLTNRFKKEGKWYLVFTDGTNNYTERQDKAKRNKKLAKDTVIETIKRVIAGLLPAPIDPLDYYVAQCIRIRDEYNNSLKSNPANYTTKGTLKRTIQRQIITDDPSTGYGFITPYGLEWTKEMHVGDQCAFIFNICNAVHKLELLRTIKHNLIRSYHPDTNSYFADPIKLQEVINL